ncbi:MAG: L,D-transpeptidase [Acidimicrobiales bacterium]
MRHARLIAAATLLVGALVAAVVLWPRAHDAPAAAPTTTTATTLAATTTTIAQPAGEAADPVGDRVDLFSAPGDVLPLDTLSNPTGEGVALAMLVKGRAPGWLHVQYPKRPNEAMAWVRAEQVTTRTVDNRIQVQVGTHTLTVYKGNTDQVLFQAPVATGTARTPTPLGSFFVDIIVDLVYKTGVYGPYQVSVAGFSNVLQSFGGGVGQIAIHGTNQPQLIGTDVSNGCIRMHNEDITALVALIRTGSPVEVVA